MPNAHQKRTRTDLVEALRKLRPVIQRVEPKEPRDAVRYTVPPHLQHLLDAATERFADCFAQLTKEVGIEFVAMMMPIVLTRRDGEPNAETVEAIKDELQAFPLENRTVARIVRGASFERGTSCALGPFSFLQWPDEAAHLKALPFLPDRELHDALYLKAEDRCVFAVVRVGGYRIGQAADAVADDRFEQLENMLRYMLRDQAGYDLGIFEFREPHLRRMVSISPTWSTMGVEPRGTASLVPLDRPLFMDETLGHDRLWGLLSKEADALNDMDRRILTAVGWLGRGIYAMNPAAGLVQFMFAYEALLNYEGDREARFSPSLGHGMAEIAAFVLSEDREERKATWSQLKELYGLRCGIAHGARSTVPRRQYNEARQVVSDLVTRLLVDPRLKQFSKLQELRDWTTEARFS